MHACRMAITRHSTHDEDIAIWQQHTVGMDTPVMHFAAPFPARVFHAQVNSFDGILNMSQKMEEGAPGIFADAVQQGHYYPAEIVCSSTGDQDLRFIARRAEGKQDGDPLFAVLPPMRTSHLR